MKINTDTDLNHPSPVNSAVALLLRRLSTTCLGLILDYAPPRKAWLSSRVVGSLVTRKTVLPSFRSNFRADLIGEKRAGWSQV